MKTKFAIGLMSGTSIDGIDAALVAIKPDQNFELIHFQNQPYTPAQRAKILALCDPKTATLEDICRGNMELGHYFAQAVIDLVKDSGFELGKIDFIGSHGQTIYHMPGHSTLQIGEPAVIANKTGIITVADFRPADIALGGQGAPLVPYFDQLFFRHLAPVAIQNIGGIGNVTVLDKEEQSLPYIAFDTGPGNMIIDAVVAEVTAGKLNYDQDGAIASRGEVDELYLCELLKHPYFFETPPKTTGRELFGQEFTKKILAETSLNHEDLVATVTAFTAATIAEQYKRFVLPYTKLEQVIVAGGGSYNKTLLLMLERRLNLKVITHEELGISGDAKEAIAFAYLAKATLEGKTNNVPAATGGKLGILGKVCYPAPNLEKETR